MPEFSSYSFLTGLMPILALYTLVFSLFEKVQKERFVINQTNQQTRKIFCELVNSGCATVMVDSFGYISFFNESFRSLVCDRLLFDDIPSNVLKIFEEDSPDRADLEQMLIEVI